MPKHTYSICPRLNSDVFKEALLDFRELSATVLASRSEDDQLCISAWSTQVDLLSTHFAFRPDSITSIANQVFGQEPVRDFVLEMHFRFFALSGSGEDYINRLIQNLVDALCLDGPDLTYSILPATVSESSAISIFSKLEAPGLLRRIFGRGGKDKEAQFNLFLFLRNNLWIVVVLLVYLAGIVTEDRNPQ